MRRSLSTLLVAAASAAFATAAIAGAPRVLADLTGKWIISVSLPDRVSQSLIDWKQDADTVSGHVEIEGMGNSSIYGIVRGDTVDFEFSIEIQGQALDIGGSGILRGKDSLDGSLYLPNNMGSFPFVAKRLP